MLAGLQRLFQYLPPEQALTRLRSTLGLLRTPGPEQPQLLVVADDGAILGAILVQALIGATGIVWPPQVMPLCPNSAAITDALVREAVAALQKSQVRFIQSVVMESEAPAAAALTRAGFVCPTELLYLRHDLDLPLQYWNESDQLRFQTYQASTCKEFHDVLAESYEQTGDFPEMNGRRTLAETIAGLQANGFDPERWWLASSVRGAVGVLALNTVEPDSWEIAYVGVVPRMRRQGWGRELVRKALFETKAAGVHELILSVDMRNEPAVQLYRSLGFSIYDRRAVYLLLE